MQTALRMTTKVHQGGRIELILPELTDEETVEVIILFPKEELPSSRQPKRSVMEILDNLLGHRIFHTAADVEQYLQEEHGAWGN